MKTYVSKSILLCTCLWLIASVAMAHETELEQVEKDEMQVSGKVMSEAKKLRLRLDKLIETHEEKQLEAKPKGTDDMLPGQRFLRRYYGLSESDEFPVIVPDEPEIVYDKAMNDEKEVSYHCQYLDFKSGMEQTIFVKPGYKTDIILPVGDKLERVTAGDKRFFEFTTFYDKQNSIWHVYVLTKLHDVSTNIIISTDRHNFQARLETSELLRPFVRWDIGEEPKPFGKREIAFELDSVRDLYFGYERPETADSEWELFNIFDDGKLNTYLTFKAGALKGMNPTIFGYLGDNAVEIASYVKRGDTLVVHGIYDRFQLRIGHKVINIKRMEHFDGRNFAS